jgi:hypothetical protein
LHFTHGNPLTIIVTVGEALRAGIDTKDRLDDFVGALRNGEAVFEDEETEGRSKSLGASLSYGFGNALSEDERKILAVLHLFQGFVQVGALCTMGDPDAEWCLDTLRGLTREQGIALLNRAAELGLLNVPGRGCYGIHPVLPWYFRDLFERYFPAQAGDRAAVPSSEPWVDPATTTWGSTKAEIARFIDLATDGRLPGREEEWSQVTSYRVGLAKMARDWTQAEQLQRVRLDWDRERAQPSLRTAPEARNNKQRDAIRTIGSSIHEFAAYREAFDLAKSIGDAAGQAICAHNLGAAYIEIRSLICAISTRLNAGLEKASTYDPLATQWDVANV